MTQLIAASGTFVGESQNQSLNICFSQIHTKQINTLCGQNVELLNVKLVVQIVTTGL